MTDQPIPSDLNQLMGRSIRNGVHEAPPFVIDVLAPHEAVAERIETRRAAVTARHPEPPSVAPIRAECDGWGLVPVLAADGSGYEPAACLGCALCSEVRPAQRQRDPFARLPVVDLDEVW